MVPSFDSVASSLLCLEDDILDDYATIEEEFEKNYWNNGSLQTQCKKRSFGGGGGEGPPLVSDECIAVMVEKECHYLPESNYLKRLESGHLDFGARKEAVEWIQKLDVLESVFGRVLYKLNEPAFSSDNGVRHVQQGSASFSFGPLCTYLAISYLDRFISIYDLPKGKAWTMELLSLACLSLAAKLEETEVPLAIDLQVGGLKFIFEAKTIQRMELLVLSTLSWRMQAITPFSFIDFFLHKINDDHQIPFSRSSQLILSTVQGPYFLEFRQSEIAAAVAICVAREIQAIDSEKAISTLSHHVEIEKERVMKCVKMIQQLLLNIESENDSRAYIQSFPRSPSGVLDSVCFSSMSEGSDKSSSRHIGESKRTNRNLNQNCELQP